MHLNSISKKKTEQKRHAGYHINAKEDVTNEEVQADETVMQEKLLEILSAKVKVYT